MDDAIDDAMDAAHDQLASRRHACGRRPVGARAGWARPAAALLLLSGCSDFGIFARTEPAPDPVQVEEVFEQAPRPQVDVLWVVDNTASMGEEQVALAGAFGGFVDALDGLELSWQAGVVTADVESDQAGILQGNPWIVHAELDDPSAAFEQAVDVGTDGSGPEAGLGAAWLALSEPRISEENRGFRRPGASLHVVVVSDADDDSETVLGSDPAGAFVAFLDAQADASGADAVLSAVVGTSPDDCDGAQLASTTIAVAEATGGAVQSICEADFSQVTSAIGEASITWPTRFTLQAEPQPDSVEVRFDGVRQDEGWTVDAAARLLVFDEPPPPGAQVSVTYTLAEDEA